MAYRFQNRESVINFLSENINSSHPIISALKQEELIIFVGSGMSYHLDMPSWKGFALELLDLIYDNQDVTLLNYKTKENLKKEPTKKLLSICKHIINESIEKKVLNSTYNDMFTTDLSNIDRFGLYDLLYNLNAIYITTNYDNALDLLAQKRNNDIFKKKDDAQVKTDATIEKKVYWDINDFNQEILRTGNIIHLHGSINNPDDMIVSNEDYINRYGNESPIKDLIRPFLKMIFCDYVILFIGYGLEEFEILQYLFNEDSKENESDINNKRYLLLDCFADDYMKINFLSYYYSKYYHININSL